MNELVYKCLPSYMNIFDTARILGCIRALGVNLGTCVRKDRKRLDNDESDRCIDLALPYSRRNHVQRDPRCESHKLHFLI